MAVHQPRPFDINEPSLIAPVEEPSDYVEPVSPPGEHAEHQNDPETPEDDDVVS